MPESATATPELETITRQRDAALAALADLRSRLESAPPPAPTAAPAMAPHWPQPIPSPSPAAAPGPAAVQAAAQRAAISQKPRDLLDYLRLRRR